MKEIWKDIKGYEGLYQVSNLGRVKSLKRLANDRNGFRNVSEKIKNLRTNNRGYSIINLSKNGERKTYKVHRLVAQAFIPNLSNKPQLNHKDGNKQNNRVNNLEWCTISENQKHAYNKNLRNVQKRGNNGNSKPVNQYDLNGNFIKRWDCITDACEMLNIQQSGISSCCIGIYKTSHGYIWKYADKDTR